MSRWGGWIRAGMLVSGLLFGGKEAQAQRTAAELLEAYRPKQADVEYETPPKSDWAKCKVEVEKTAKTHGYVVLGPEGQVLRRFVDTEDEDPNVDQFRYYQHGIEVYREIDTNNNNKVDQFRWLNLGGSRWGVDLNEDGRIDQWKSLSAAEASREAIRAMTAGDAAALQLLMVTAEDLKALGVLPALQQKILEQTAGAGTKAQAIVRKSAVLTPKSRWVRFDALMPSVIPADEGKAAQDLYVYENAIALVELGAPARPNAPVATSVVQIGEMIRVGEVWKLTQVPQPIEGENFVSSGGVLMQPLAAAAPVENLAVSPELQQLIDELQKLDQNPPQFGTATAAQLASYYQQRSKLLLKLVDLAPGAEEKANFLKQCVDGLAAAVQTDAYPNGLKDIQALEADLQKSRSPVLPYVMYRRIMSQYAVDMKAASPEKRTEIQQQWLERLSEFVGNYPAADDAPDAMWQVATAHEFSGKVEDAVQWYQRLTRQKSDPLAANKAAGAMRRLNLKGKPFVLSGQGLDGQPINTGAYRGKVLLVVYWATWSDLFKQDLPQLRALHQQYRSKGFEVLGVCLDIFPGSRQQQAAEVQKFIRESNVPWPQIFEPGGLDSPPAVQYGIISVPTLFLVDQKGDVLSRNSSVQELKDVLPKVLPK
uniref:TlpA family protein disulfide reductase n=1 Tax=Schlesneria paludicola TaxID=360056 RepID=A0A7C4LNS9_9PLAN